MPIIKKVREVIRILEKDGWYRVRVKGSHWHFNHPVKPGTVTIPVHKLGGDVDPGIFRSIMKAAQIPEEEWR